MEEGQDHIVKEGEVLNAYKSELEKLNGKSQEAFEKQFSFISSGAIGVSLLLVEKFFSVKDESVVRGTTFNMLFIAGMSLLVLSLMSNLLSHPFSAWMTEKTIGDIDQKRFSKRKALKRWAKVKWFNITSIISLSLGITCIIFFITLNTLNMSDQTTKINTPPPGHETGTKGYVPSSTPSIEQQPAPAPVPSQPMPSTPTPSKDVGR